MMLARILPHLVAKEVRALLPFWLASVAALACVFALGRWVSARALNIQTMELFVYGGASVTLGALSIGHEYTNRTLSLLLSQPASRARVFVAKQFVLAMMLLILALVVWINVLLPSQDVTLVIVLVALGGLFVTPWLTMLSRNPLAGAVFTGPIAGLIWLLVEVTVARPMRLVIFQWVMLGVCAMAAVLGWRAFSRLQAIEGPGASLRWPAAGAAPAARARARHPIWLLLKKELALQHLALVVATVYLVGWGLSLFGEAGGRFRDDLFGGVTFLYSGQLAVLIGALASAGERQLGTLEWQGLLPIAWWKQWAAKVATVFALSTLLTVALPALLLSTSRGGVEINRSYLCAMLLLTTAGLYVSSLNSSGMRALVVSIAVSLIAFAAALAVTLGRWHGTPVSLVFLAAFVAIGVYFALLNHRSSERDPVRIGLQVTVMAGCLAFATAVATLAW